MRIEDSQIIALLKARAAASLERIRSGNSKVQRDEQGNIIPSPSNLKPNVFDLMPKSQTSGEGDA